MKIAVFGCGFVGGTPSKLFRKNRNRYNKSRSSIISEQDPQQAILDASGIIICVPTPSDAEGKCDDSIVPQGIRANRL